MSLLHSLLFPRREGFFSNERIIPPLFFGSLAFSLSQKLLFIRQLSLCWMSSVCPRSTLCAFLLGSMPKKADINSWLQWLSWPSVFKLGLAELEALPEQKIRGRESREVKIHTPLVPPRWSSVCQLLSQKKVITLIRHPSPIPHVFRKWQLLLLCPQD